MPPDPQRLARIRARLLAAAAIAGCAHPAVNVAAPSAQEPVTGASTELAAPNNAATIDDDGAAGIATGAGDGGTGRHRGATLDAGHGRRPPDYINHVVAPKTSPIPFRADTAAELDAPLAIATPGADAGTAHRRREPRQPADAGRAAPDASRRDMIHVMNKTTAPIAFSASPAPGADPADEPR